jgi:membrane protein DedA with SNARE-associated domain
MRWRIIKRQKTPEYLEKARIWFHKYGVWTIYVGRVIPGMGFAVIFCCGILKIKRWKVYPAIFISNLLFLGILVVIGRYVGEQWQTFMRVWGKVTSWAGIVLLLAGIFLFLIYRYMHKKRVSLSPRSYNNTLPTPQQSHNHLHDEINNKQLPKHQQIDHELEDR